VKQSHSPSSKRSAVQIQGTSDQDGFDHDVRKYDAVFDDVGAGGIPQPSRVDADWPNGIEMQLRAGFHYARLS